MSRMGKRPVDVPEGVSVEIHDDEFVATGPRGSLSVLLESCLNVRHESRYIYIEPKADMAQLLRTRVMWGTQRSLINNAIIGVSRGFSKKLEIVGVGFRAALQGKDLRMSLGFSHDVVLAIPDGIMVGVPKPTEVVISGIDKVLVGLVASRICRIRKPDPYKGKGVRYAGAYVRRKAGKKK